MCAWVNIITLGVGGLVAGKEVAVEVGTAVEGMGEGGYRQLGSPLGKSPRALEEAAAAVTVPAAAVAEV